MRVVAVVYSRPRPLSNIFFAGIFPDKKILPSPFQLHGLLFPTHSVLWLEILLCFKVLVFPAGNTVNFSEESLSRRPLSPCCVPGPRPCHAQTQLRTERGNPCSPGFRPGCVLMPRALLGYSRPDFHPPWGLDIYRLCPAVVDTHSGLLCGRINELRDPVLFITVFPRAGT